MKLIQVKTKQEWNDVVGKAIGEGFEWLLDSKDLKTDWWDDFKENSVIGLFTSKYLECGSISYFQERFPNHKIISAKEYLKPDGEKPEGENMKNKIKTLMFFNNGNTAVFDCENKQLPKFQKSWLLMFIEFLQEEGVEVEKIEEILLPGGREVKYLKEYHNWEIK